MRARFYCGCCGGECPETAMWCDRCARHVGKDGPPWDRTYRAVHDEPCPFDVSLDPLPPQE